MQRILCSKYFCCKNSVRKIFEGALHLYRLKLMLFYYFAVPFAAPQEASRDRYNSDLDPGCNALACPRIPWWQRERTTTPSILEDLEDQVIFENFLPIILSFLSYSNLLQGLSKF